MRFEEFLLEHLEGLGEDVPAYLYHSADCDIIRYCRQNFGFTDIDFVSIRKQFEKQNV